MTEVAPRRVGTGPSEKSVREARRDLIATMLLTKTPYRTMIVAIREQLRLETSVGTVTQDVAVIRERWKQRVAESYESHVAEQMGYYDGLLRATMIPAMQGDATAVQATLSILDRRARLLGLDQPAKVDARVMVAHVSAAEALAKLDEREADDRAAGIAAVLSDAGVFGYETTIDVESRVRTGEAAEAPGVDGPEADEVHRAGPDDQAGSVSAA